jgi:hypothetical protein
VKLFALLFLTISLLIARDNPFASIPTTQPIDTPDDTDIKELTKPSISIKKSTKLKTVVEKKVSASFKQADVKEKIVKISPPKTEKNRLLIAKTFSDSDSYICLPICEEKPHNDKNIRKRYKTSKNKRVGKIKKRVKKAKQLFNNYFLKALYKDGKIKLYTKSCLFRKKEFKNPKRFAFDFRELQYFKTKSHKNLDKKFRYVKFGSHHNFYRITVTSDKKIKIKKTDFGYLIY